MRSKNAFRNLIVSLVYEVFILALGLIVPRFIILSYGDSINGLTQTIHRLLTLVNLLQTGAVGASIFAMLKPVAEDDYEKQSAVMYASKKFFDRMGIIYLSIIMVCSLFFGFRLREDNLSVLEVVLSFCILALNGSLYFFFTARFDILFSSYQKKYLLTVASFVERIVYYILLFLVIFAKLHFLFMYMALLCSGIVRVSINGCFYRKLTKGKIVKKPKDRHYEIKDRKFLMMASIGDQAVEAAPTVIVTTLIGLASSSVFSVYSMVYISLKTLINSFHHAVSAIFGNLVASSSSDDNKVREVFDALLYVFMMLGALLSSCCAFLFMGFIKLYSEGFTEGMYIQPTLACFVVAYIGVFAVRVVFNFVSHSYGLFRQTCKATLVCGAISLIVSVVATMLWGMPCVMAGVVLYHLSSMCVLIYYFKQKISWFRIESKWLLRVAVMIIFPVISWVAYNANVAFTGTWLYWLLSAVIYVIVVGCALLIYTLVFDRKAFFMLMGYLKAIVRPTKTK